MKGALLLVFVLLASLGGVLAQDKIVKRNGEIIDGKVREIGIREVKYSLNSDPESAIFVIGKREIRRIAFENGQVVKINEELGKRLPDIDSSKIARNIIAIVPFRAIDFVPGFGLTFERLVGEQKNFGIVLPVTVAFEERGDYFNTQTNRFLTYVYFSPGVKFYPFGHKKVSYAIGGNLFAGYAKGNVNESFYEPGGSELITEKVDMEVLRLGFIGNNYLSVLLTPRLSAGLHAGLGIRYLDKVERSSTRSGISDPFSVSGEFSINFNLHF